jgi:hypothetical protein
MALMLRQIWTFLYISKLENTPGIQKKCLTEFWLKVAKHYYS